QERVVPADDARIEVRNGHRRGTDRGLAVDLGMTPLVQRGMLTAQPDAAHGKPAIAFFLGDSGLLQQRQRAASGAEKDEFCGGRSPVAGPRVFCGPPPAPAALASDIVHVVGVMDGKAREPLEIADEMAGKGTAKEVW